MDPLMVEGGVGKHIDALLINEEPFTCSEFLAEMRGELVVRIDD